MFRIFLFLGLCAIALARPDIPEISDCKYYTFDRPFSTVLRCNTNKALVPVNLRRDTSVVGPPSLNAINLVTLGLPKPSKFGDVTVARFTLKDGWLVEQHGLNVNFEFVDGFPANEFDVTTSNVLRATACGGECGGFCVDRDGFLVSVTPIRISFMGKADLVTDKGKKVPYRVKYFACPTENRDIFGGGDYESFSNSVPNPETCVPIYLGVQCTFL
jgi:hypothetical protein